MSTEIDRAGEWFYNENQNESSRWVLYLDGRLDLETHKGTFIGNAWCLENLPTEATPNPCAEIKPLKTPTDEQFQTAVDDYLRGYQTCFTEHMYDFTLIYPKKCEHEWKEYVGLTNRFDYCVHCDEKRNS